MKILRIITFLKIERDFRITGIMKRTKLHKRLPKLYSLLKFRMNQNGDMYEIFLGIRDFDGKYNITV